MIDPCAYETVEFDSPSHLDKPGALAVNRSSDLISVLPEFAGEVASTLDFVDRWLVLVALKRFRRRPEGRADHSWHIITEQGTGRRMAAGEMLAQPTSSPGRYSSQLPLSRTSDEQGRVDIQACPNVSPHPPAPRKVDERGAGVSQLTIPRRDPLNCLMSENRFSILCRIRVDSASCGLGSRATVRQGIVVASNEPVVDPKTCLDVAVALLPVRAAPDDAD